LASGGDDEAGDDGLLRVAAVAVGRDVPGVPAGQDGDGFEEGRSGVEQSGVVFGRVPGGQLAVRDELAEGGPAWLVI
jgi:hypothetical protein